MIILVMGVSGSGKTTVGRLLARSLGWQFSDADDFHSPDNIDKMRRGIPLTDADRAPWLQALQTAIQAWLRDQENVVLACSALKQSYRQSLSLDSKQIKWVYLQGTNVVIQERLQLRHNHYMTEKLLSSQFEALEEPTDALYVDIDQSPEAIVQTVRSALGMT